ncbi:DUF6215 domain-containing protein [Streptomyces sp. NPDC047082]|uniref:DUF6215 domain-containing protein n=1 Tax=Streptomyces sp. NPDC047082 TaxID=3155259 RepID=UPI0033FFB123
MADDFAESEKGPSAGVQATAAVVLVGGLIGGMWGLGEVTGHNDSDSEPAVCSSTHTKKQSSKRVSGAQLCTAPNRPDLPTLLGTPTEHAESASGGESEIKLAGGTKIATPEADVTLPSYSVKLSASYDDLSVTEMTDLMGRNAQKQTVLGHPAVLYSDRTIAITFNGSKADTGPGGIARCLMVARNPKDGGGSFEVTIWRQDDVPPDDAALFRVAERVLPTVPGWTVG